jgi:hypothetical protein
MKVPSAITQTRGTNSDARYIKVGFRNLALVDRRGGDEVRGWWSTAEGRRISVGSRAIPFTTRSGYAKRIVWELAGGDTDPSIEVVAVGVANEVIVPEVGLHYQ